MPTMADKTEFAAALMQRFSEIPEENGIRWCSKRNPGRING